MNSNFLLFLRYVFDNEYSAKMMSKKPFHMSDIYVVFHLYEFVYVDLKVKVDQTFSHIHHMSKISVYVDYYSHKCLMIEPWGNKKKIEFHRLSQTYD